MRSWIILFVMVAKVRRFVKKCPCSAGLQRRRRSGQGPALWIVPRAQATRAGLFLRATHSEASLSRLASARVIEGSESSPNFALSDLLSMLIGFQLAFDQPAVTAINKFCELIDFPVISFRERTGASRRPEGGQLSKMSSIGTGVRNQIK